MFLVMFKSIESVQKTIMKEPRLAATILLGRDHEGALEVLLLKRNKALAFAGGLWVFPGGKIDPDELEQGADEMAAAKLAAVRETKEEADLDIKIDDLVFYHHWTTPVVEPRRFATYFFYAPIEQLDAKVQIDDGEIKEHMWVRPADAIEKLRAGELAMLPPTLMSLQLVSKCRTAAEAHAFLKNRTPIFILPVLEMKGFKMTCLYEGDAGYETGDAKTEGARHRLSIDLAKGDFVFEFENCENVLPVNGGMHK